MSSAGACPRPEGAFYVFPNVRGALGCTLKDDVALCTHWLEEVGVAAVPGAGFQAVGRCRSRDEVGGDLCELVSLAEGKTLVAVGDACGHSVQAAFIMTAVRSALSTVLDDENAPNLPPAAVVARMNRALCRVTAGHHFMSCLVGIVDSRRMTRDDLRERTGMVLQDSWLFGGTIYENIAYGPRIHGLASTKAEMDRIVEEVWCLDSPPGGRGGASAGGEGANGGGRERVGWRAMSIHWL